MLIDVGPLLNKDDAEDDDDDEDDNIESNLLNDCASEPRKTFLVYG